MRVLWVGVLFCLIWGTPATIWGDILLPGHKSVKHQLVFEDSAAFQQHRLIAAPIAGFSGVEEILPGRPFAFSTKYGTAFYLVPRDQVIPEFDRERFDQWPHQSPPVTQIRSRPVTSLVASALTTLKFSGLDESGVPIIEQVSHRETDRNGKPANTSRSLLLFGLCAAAGLVLCLLALRRLRAGAR